jgi:hypothetical protein
MSPCFFGYISSAGHYAAANHKEKAMAELWHCARAEDQHLRCGGFCMCPPDNEAAFFFQNAGPHESV